MSGTHVGGEGRLQHSRHQAFEVDGAEDGVGFDLRRSAPLAARPLRGIFGQELQRGNEDGYKQRGKGTRNPEGGKGSEPSGRWFNVCGELLAG